MSDRSGPAADPSLEQSGLRWWADVYLTSLKLEWKSYAQYRANMALWLIGILVEPVVYLVVWVNVVRAHGGSLAGYDQADLATYYLALMFVRQFTAASNSHAITARIRSGSMSMLLLRPLAPMHSELAWLIAGRLSTVIPLIPITVLVGLTFGARWSAAWWSLLAAVLAVLLAGLIRFFLQYGIALVGFWTDRVDGIFSTYWTMQAFLGGMLAPITFLPLPLRILADWLPFRWFFAFPVDLILGKLSVQEMMLGFAAQLGWCVVAGLIMMGLWRAGVRRYGAFGG